MQEDSFDSNSTGAVTQPGADPHTSAVHTLVRLEPHVIHALTLLQRACQPLSPSALWASNVGAAPPQSDVNPALPFRWKPLPTLFTERAADIEFKCKVRSFYIVHKVPVHVKQYRLGKKTHFNMFLR